jgi:hypothetical protein
MAGLRTVEELLARASDLCDIAIFGAEPGESALLHQRVCRGAGLCYPPL